MCCTGRKDIKLVSLKVAGKEHTDYDVTEKQLTLSKLPKGEFEVEIDVDIKPQVRRPSQVCSCCLVDPEASPVRVTAVDYSGPLAVGPTNSIP